MDESPMNHYSLKQEDDSSYAPLMATNYANPSSAGSLSRWSASQPNFSLQYQPYPSNLPNGNDPMLYQQPPQQQQQQSSPLHDNSLPDLITNGLQFASHAASTYPTPPMSSMSPSATISRPPSVVHSPHQEAFSRARATSYSGPYTLHPTFAMAEYQNYQQSQQAQAQQQQQQQQQASYAHPLRMSIVAPLSAPVPAQQPQRAPHASEQPLPKSEPPQPGGEYYVAQGLDQYQAQASRTLSYLPDGNMTNRLPQTPVTLPNPGTLAEGTSYTPTASSTAGYTYTGNATFAPPSAGPASHTPLTNSSMQQDVRLRPPIPPLSTSIATGGLNAIPRSMSTGSIANGNGHGLPSGAYGAHGRFPRSSIAPLSSISIPQNGPMDRAGSEYDQIYSSPSSALSPSSGAIFSNSLLHLRGTGSGPGTSNGGSVPLTPTTDDTDTTDHYNSFSRGNSRLSISNGYMDLQPNGSSVDDDMDDDDDEDTMNDSRPLRIRGIRRATKTGCNRTEKKRRSATIAAGPSAAAVGNRSRSGTMAAGVNGPSGLNPIGFSSLSIGMDDTTSGQMGTSVASMPFGVLGEVGHGQGAGTAVAAGAGAHSAVGHPTGTSSHGHGMGGQTHSPLAMKELSPSIKPVIEDYLLRYLNYLCINPNAKDRMGHQIHQMYTARRIQRYEQLYGYRPLKFRIEAFVNGFVDLLTANGLSQDITMKIPHYLNSSNLFSRFNESGNRMKSQGQTIWRVKAKSRTDIPSVDVTGQTITAHHSASFAQHHAAVSAVGHAHAGGEDGPVSGMMMCPDPLLWEFIPYERCIVGQPPLAIVGSAWQWNMKVHDHWTPRKKVTWKVSGGTVSSISSASSSDDTSSSSPSTSSVSGQTAPSGTGSATSGSGSTSAQGPMLCALPSWVQQQGAKLKGTPTAPGIYPIAIEATFQDDSDPEPLIVRGNFTIQVSRAIGGWNKTTVTTADGTGLGHGALGGMGEDAMDADDADDDGSGGLNGSAGSGGGSVRDAHGNEHFIGGYGAYPTTYLGNPYPMTYNYPYTFAYVQ